MWWPQEVLGWVTGVRGSLSQASSCSELCHSRASISNTQPLHLFRPQLRVSPDLGRRKLPPLEPDPPKSSFATLLSHSGTVHLQIPLISPLNIIGPLSFPPASRSLCTGQSKVPECLIWVITAASSRVPVGATLASSNLFSHDSQPDLFKMPPTENPSFYCSLK